jgi:DNA-binding MarR family transcriptional regulator
LPEGAVATIGELASRLQLKHHSTGELVNRLEKLRYVARVASKEDKRAVIVHLTPAGARILRKLSLAHHQELEIAGPRLARALRGIARHE